MMREYVVKVTDALVPDAFLRFEDEWSPEQELVRCKDCKHLEHLSHLDEINGKECYVCRKHTFTGMRSPDWFCADGERR